MSGLSPILIPDLDDIAKKEEAIPEKAHVTWKHIVLIGILVVAFILLITLALMIWYCKNKTGTIEATDVEYKVPKKPAPEPKNSAIKITKYEPCDTDDKTTA